MRLSRTLLVSLALSLVALLVSAGVCELIVRGFVPVRNIGHSFTIYDPFYGKIVKKRFSTYRITPEFRMQFTTNSDGFRGPEPGHPSLRSILFLGDSFTMGYGVTDGDEFPALVRKALNDGRPDTFSVINAGMGDNGNGRCVKFLQAEGKKYNPGLVVLQIHENDFKDNIREQIFELTPANSLIERPVPSPGMRWKLQKLVEGVPGLANSYFVGFARQVIWDTIYSSQDSDADDSHVDQGQLLLEDQLLFSLIQEVLTICEEEKWPILAVIVDISGKRLTKLEKFFAARNVSTVIIPTKQERPDLYYKADGHWNTFGHRFAADQILQVIDGLVL